MEIPGAKYKRLAMQTFSLIMLFFLALSERVVFDLGPNIELVTATMLLAVFYFGQKQALLLTAAVLIVSDLIIGNSLIFLFTWSGFLIPVVIIGTTFGKRNFEPLQKIFLGTSSGIISNLFFYFWTNFGVWMLDTWGMYTNDMSGLLSSYINALPFLRLQLTSTLIFVPTGFVFVEILKAIYPYFASKFVPQYANQNLPSSKA